MYCTYELCSNSVFAWAAANQACRPLCGKRRHGGIVYWVLVCAEDYVGMLVCLCMYFLRFHWASYAYVNVHIIVYIHTYIHTYKKTYIHTYMHTCIHTHIHDCIFTFIIISTQKFLHKHTFLSLKAQGQTYIHIHNHFLSFLQPCFPCHAHWMTSWYSFYCLWVACPDAHYSEQTWQSLWNLDDFFIVCVQHAPMSTTTNIETAVSYGLSH